MPEELNVEIAHKLAESEEAPKRPRRTELIEIAEAVVLALVAVATAWSGYQAARWEGRQAFLYGQSSRLRVEAGVAATDGRLQRLFDAIIFIAWNDAAQANNQKLAAVYVQRFSPEFRVAFAAWLKTNPSTNPNAPTGPFRMGEYHNALVEQAGRLNNEATAAFTEGTQDRETAETYIRTTVLLAMVLFLTAIAQRFKVHNVRVAVLLVAAALVVDALVTVGRLARL